MFDLSCWYIFEYQILFSEPFKKYKLINDSFIILLKIEPSCGCSNLEEKANTSLCWDPEGQVISINSSRHGTICQITNNDNIRSIVKCTRRGWSTVEKNYDSNASTVLSPF